MQKHYYLQFLEWVVWFWFSVLSDIWGLLRQCSEQGFSLSDNSFLPIAYRRRITSAHSGRGGREQRISECENRTVLNCSLLYLNYISSITHQCRNGFAFAGFTDDLFHHVVGSGRDCRPVFCTERTKQRVRNDAGTGRAIHSSIHPSIFKRLHSLTVVI